jgi:hypothetical protein
MPKHFLLAKMTLPVSAGDADTIKGSVERITRGHPIRRPEKRPARWEHHDANARDNSASSPSARTASVSSRPPACDPTPDPAAST